MRRSFRFTVPILFLITLLPTVALAVDDGPDASAGAPSVTSSAIASASLPAAYYLAPIGAIVALIMAFVFYKGFMQKSEGDDNMVRIAAAVRDGAYAYLGKQAKVVYIVVAILALILFAMGIAGLQTKLTWVGVVLASVLSGACGFLGMKTATNASARTAHAAKESLNDALRVAFRAGAVMGLCVTGFALLDVSIWFLLLHSMGEFTLVQLTTITQIGRAHV